MATPSHAHAVKSLNKSPGRRRFVFKTFSQRIEDVEIDVYRSLDKIKLEPSEGSSFFPGLSRGMEGVEYCRGLHLIL